MNKYTKPILILLLILGLAACDPNTLGGSPSDSPHTQHCWSFDGTNRLDWDEPILEGDSPCHTPPADATRRRLQEDDPGWNCLTHGNGICGPVHVDSYSDRICADSPLNGFIGCFYSDFYFTPSPRYPNAFPGYVCQEPFLFCTKDITRH